MKPIKEPTETQRAEPDRKAEIAVYDAMLAIDLEGNLLYDVRVRKQIDMYLEIPHQWRGAVEVKGGYHMLKDGGWYRRETDGNFTKLKDSPLEQAVAGAMAIRDALKERLEGRECWINAVLALPGMSAEDPEITKLAKDNKVSVIWGLDSLGEQLLQIIQAQPDWEPPDELDMEPESAALVGREPPPLWLSRQASEKGSDVSTISADLPALSGNPALRTGARNPVSAMYSFVINNYGTMYINIPDPQTSTPNTDAAEIGTGGDDPGHNTETDSASDSNADAGVEFDGPPVVDPDPSGEAIVGDGFDDQDPFS